MSPEERSAEARRLAALLMVHGHEDLRARIREVLATPMPEADRLPALIYHFNEVLESDSLPSGLRARTERFLREE